MKKTLLVATVQSHIAQFHRPLVDFLHEMGYEVHVAAKDNLAIKNGLRLDWVDKKFDLHFSRSPKSPSNLKAYRQLKEIINNEDYDFIHCNTPVGGVLTRLASREARKKGSKVIYTAHGFHFHKRSSKLAWLTYYPIEKFCARHTDKLITINNEDFNLAKERFKCEVYYTHGVGVNAERYKPLKDEEERLQICEELGVDPNRKILLAIGELLPNKNQKMAIRAMKSVVREFSEAQLIIAGNGPLEQEFKTLIKEENLDENVSLIGYCTQLEKYQKIASIVVACSYREGLPLNVVEAMLSENPVVASSNRGHDELVKTGKTGFIVNPDDSEAMASKVIELLKNPEEMNSLGKKGREFAQNFSFENVKKELKEVYGI